jgi:hypothetical protein
VDGDLVCVESHTQQLRKQRKKNGNTDTCMDQFVLFSIVIHLVPWGDEFGLYLDGAVGKEKITRRKNLVCL